ncbi:MAG TPA: TIM barrel protein [Cyclobacteriaceae bacterium]|nr:TIM barrel protein [Cyclobacteriaceae bacterium]
MNRRDFLQMAGTLSMAGMFNARCIWPASGKLKNIGIQLFSLPKLLENDFRGTIKMLTEMGYREIEMYGPYPFSAPSAIERWNAITPSLGFNGSGYFGNTIEEVKTILNDFKISAPSIHIDLETLHTRMEEVGEAGEILGHKYAGIAAIPDDRRKNLDGYKNMADEFNILGEKAKKAGLKFIYHNHGYGLKEMEGQVPLNVLLERTDPELVFFEMDLFWTTAGGADPVGYLNSYPGRYHLLHIKDMKERVRFSGDGGNSDQWIELFPYMTTAGAGILDLPSIITTAIQNGVRHFIVEQDMVSQPELALRESIDYLKSL